MKGDVQDHARVFRCPPLIYFGTLVVGLLIHRAFPIGFLPNGLQLGVSLPRIAININPTLILTVSVLQLGVSLPLIAIGILLNVWAQRTFRLAGTNADPHKPTRVIVVGGPYRFTRNPMYLSLTLIYVGIAVFFDALWGILLLPVVLLVTQYRVIAREEQYLERKFGEEYLRYKRKVRRWL